jgi:hypothetical protein
MALLVDGYGGAQAFDIVDVRFLHLPQELPGIGRQRLDITALPLGVDGIERPGSSYPSRTRR